MNAKGAVLANPVVVAGATYFQVLKVTFFRGDGATDDSNVALSISKVY